MKQYVTHGTGSAQTLSEVQNTNVVVYDTKADAEADLTNLAEGQIIAIKDTGDELAQPVDTVQVGSLHAVTSNAVAEALSFTATEKISGNYFNFIRYHKTYIFSGINLVANTVYTLTSTFEIPYNKTVGIKGFIINEEVWSDDIKAFILSNGTLAVQSSLAGNNFTVVLDVYYIK